VLTSHKTDNLELGFNLRWWLPRLLQERSVVMFVGRLLEELKFGMHGLCTKVIESNFPIVSQP